MFKKIFFTLIFTFPLYVFSQIKVGEWRDHFCYKKALTLADAGDKIYVAGENAVWAYYKEEGTIEKMTKVQGYSDAEIQTLAYNKNNDALIIVYKNSNIDILKNNKIYNLSEIKRKLLSTDKTVYNITFIGNTAWLSCGFGIVLLDTDKLEFSDTYFIGNNASYVKINDIAYDGTNIYAASDNGLYYADCDEPNLADYRNWHLLPDIPDNNFKYNFIHHFGNYLFANQINSENNDTLYIKTGNQWEIFNSDIDNLVNIYSDKNEIIFTTRHFLYIYDNQLNLKRIFNTYNFSGYKPALYMGAALTDENNKLFIADYSFGLVTENESENGECSYRYPDGPFNNYTANAFAYEKTIITTDGNDRASGWYRPTYNIFQDENWESYHISLDTARNFFSIAVNPKDKNNLFIGSWGYGVFEFLNNEFTNSFNHKNSTLQPIQHYDYGYIRINGLVFDKNNNLWITNEGVGNPISVKTEDNQWESFNFNGTVTNETIKDIYVSENNLKWAIIRGSKGILVFDDNNTPLNKQDDRFKIIEPVTADGELISSVITAFSEDKDGNIWMGTGDGVVVFYNEDNAFEDDFFADRIQLTSYGKDTTEQYLLQTDIVTDIETDGGNRKWLATQNSGAFLVSENGKEEIYHFDKYNSPLISNTINDIAIIPETGEVFFLTDKGIMSFRAEATEASDKFADVYVFPNPVRPGYEGKITVSGLAANVNVKITDISGHLVYETKALGGQAIWNGKTFDGRRVSTGVYLIFCSNNDGSETFVSKLLFIN